MKCPKCLYIGFETGDRCKNCGYDFSLLEETSAGSELDRAEADRAADRFRDLPDRDAPTMTFANTEDFAREAVITPDTPLTAPTGLTPGLTPGLTAGLTLSAATTAAAAASASLSATAAPPARAAAVSTTEMPELPLFEPDAVDDEPLVRVPAVLRAPLSVRRTPDVPRLRQPAAVDRPRLHDDGVLQFTEEPDADDRYVGSGSDTYSSAYNNAEPDVYEAHSDTRASGDASGDASDDASDDDGVFYEPSIRAPFIPRAARGPAGAAGQVSAVGPRLVAALIDYSMLLSIDAIVLYFTLRLTDLDLADWRMLPMLPLAAFLVSLKLAYFTAFTGAGGQTIGKMATRIRVVSDDGGRLDAGRALRRAALALISMATAGAPFLPALTDPARRGVHDRAVGTRVVALSPR